MVVPEKILMKKIKKREKVKKQLAANKQGPKATQKETSVEETKRECNKKLVFLLKHLMPIDFLI